MNKQVFYNTIDKVNVKQGGKVKVAVLTEGEIQKKLKILNAKSGAWKTGKCNIYTDFIADNFVAALSLVARIGIEAEKANHHPDILIHGYKKLKVTLSTHSEGGVTGKDFKLAQKISRLLKKETE